MKVSLDNYLIGMQSANYFVENLGPYGAWQVKHNYAMLIYDDYNLGLSSLYCTNSLCLSQPLYFGCTVPACSKCSAFIKLQSSV